MVSALLVSDSEREYTVGLLRKHLLSGRLTHDEFEERVDEAWRARFATDLWQALRWLPADGPQPVRPAARPGTGIATALVALTMSLLGLALLCFSLGLASMISLPLSASGWLLGRSARRTGGRSAQAPAKAAEAIGIAGSVLALVVLAGFTAILMALL